MPVINIGIDIRQLRSGAAQATATLNGVTFSADQATSSANRLSGAIAGAAKQVLALVGAYKALEGMKGFAQRGIEFNSSMEQSKIAIASIITSMANLEDGQGKVLQGAEKYAAAQGIAADMMKEIQRLGLETTATTEELVQGVQNVMGSALNAGIKLEQIPKFAVSAAQAMQTLGIPLEQMRTELDALLTGNIDSGDDILVKRLGLDKETLDNWRQQGGSGGTGGARGKRRGGLATCGRGGQLAGKGGRACSAACAGRVDGSGSRAGGGGDAARAGAGHAVTCPDADDGRRPGRAARGQSGTGGGGTGWDGTGCRAGTPRAARAAAGYAAGRAIRRDAALDAGGGGDARHAGGRAEYFAAARGAGRA